MTSVLADTLSRDTAHDQPCFHCGERVPDGEDYSIELQGELRPMCCPGCRAVASLIADSGMVHFYDQRTAYNEKPDEGVLKVDAGASARFAIYDDPELLSQFTDAQADATLDARLLVGGVSCAACTWLIETSLQRVPGILAVSLNLAQSRLDLRFDPGRVSASEVFARVAALGYRVQPWHASAEQAQARSEYRRDLRRLAVAGIGMMQVGMFAIALHAGDIQGITADYEQLLRLFSLLVTTFVVLFSARGFFESAWRHLRQGALVMDLPVALAIGIAFGASTAATFFGGGDVYFDSVVMFTFLLLLARFIEKRLRYRDTLAWRNAEQTLPDAAMVLIDGSWQGRPRQSLQRGQRVRVRGGDIVPIDGRIHLGSSAVREDSFSGEALPREVTVGDTVYAGTLNRDGTLEIVASGSYAESRLAALQRSIEGARLEKPALARLADRLASRFIAAVLVATTGTALIWLQIDPARALWVALSVLVISCPCALSLATPATLANAAARLRRSGVIVYGENALETLATASHCLFDKTGTLTTGAFRIETVQLLTDAYEERRVLAIAAQLQGYANHPIASAFALEGVEDAQPDAVRDMQYHVGAGVEGYSKGRCLRIGSGEFCEALCADLAPPPDASLLWVALVSEDEPLAWIGINDEVRHEARGVVQRLTGLGMRCELLTGDSSSRAAALGGELGLAAAHVGQSPQDKLARVAALQSEGAVVTMIGDGLNDAPVLQRADVSVAVAGATDLARAQADFVVQRGDLTQIELIADTARRARRIIRQNFAWALGYNGIGIPLAAMGWIPPWAAALGMSASSLIVVANSSRLRHSGSFRGVAF